MRKVDTAKLGPIRIEPQTSSEKRLGQKIAQARAAAAILDAKGYPFEAEQVRLLCRAASSLHTVAATLSRDVSLLRDQRGAS